MLNEDLNTQLLRLNQKLEGLMSAQAPKMRQVGRQDSKNYETQILDFY